MPLGFQEIKALGCALFGFSLPRAGAFTVAKSVSSGCAKVWLPGFSISGLLELGGKGGGGAGDLSPFSYSPCFQWSPPLAPPAMPGVLEPRTPLTPWS